MKILVTGGSGYLGTFVRQFFSADDFSRRSGFNILEEQDAEMVRDYDVVIHLAGHLDKSPEGAQQCFLTNADGTRNILRFMKPDSVFIYASTKDVYGKHASPDQDVAEYTSTEYDGQSAFEWSKLIGERYVEFYAKQNGFRACIFRLSTVYARPTEGNDYGFVTHYVESIKNRRPIRLPAGVNPIRDLLHVDDFSRACRAFMNKSVPFRIYNLGGGRFNGVTLRMLAEKVGKMIEIEPILEEDPRIPVPVPLRYVSDLTRISNELSWRPELGVDEGLRTIL